MAAIFVLRSLNWLPFKIPSVTEIIKPDFDPGNFSR
jgi:hypothetical protein